LVNGVLKTDKTWVECEKRVKGKKGAKFQKALSEIEEKEIMKKWGIR
jgi:viroplasmin and RNaseH domain-containing protein